MRIAASLAAAALAVVFASAHEPRSAVAQTPGPAASGTPAPTTSNAPALNANAIYRVVPLSCGGERLTVAGAGVLRLAGGATCEGVVPGRAIGISLDAENRATPRKLAPGALPAAKIPRAAYAIAPAAERDADETQQVDSTIDVYVPPRTPPSDDIYVSTERSGWSPSEMRMDRVDARHFRLVLKLRRGARVAFRVTRGSFGTTERNAARALPPAHVAAGEPNAEVRVDVAAWADID
ncbi:MAG TPA: hypothetical protein VK665_17095 [Candidatus Elarobacter sp.]|nr:hypothetical protein [Candidatus Elarobacter sp.]